MVCFPSTKIASSDMYQDVYLEVSWRCYQGHIKSTTNQSHKAAVALPIVALWLRSSHSDDNDNTKLIGGP